MTNFAWGQGARSLGYGNSEFGLRKVRVWAKETVTRGKGPRVRKFLKVGLLDNLFLALMDIDALGRRTGSELAAVKTEPFAVSHFSLIIQTRSVTDARGIFNGDGARGKDEVVGGHEALEVVGNEQINTVFTWRQGLRQADVGFNPVITLEGNLAIGLWVSREVEGGVASLVIAYVEVGYQCGFVV